MWIVQGPNRSRWKYTLFILLLTSLPGHGAESPMLVEFAATSLEVNTGEEFTLTVQTSRPVTADLDVDVSCCMGEEVTLPGLPATATVSAGDDTTSIGLTPMSETSIYREIVDCYITSVDETTEDNAEIGREFSVRIIVAGSMFNIFFPNELYPDSSMRINTFGETQFELYLFLTQPAITPSLTATVSLEVNSASMGNVECSITTGVTFVECPLDITTGSLPLNVPANAALDFTVTDTFLPKAHLGDAYIEQIDDSADSSAYFYFEKGLKVVEEDAGTVEIYIVTPTAVDMAGTVELEVEPENLNSYIVSPIIVPFTNGGVRSTATVTVIDDDVDEGVLESFRIKIKCVTDITNVDPSPYSQDPGMQFVIVDNDVVSTQVMDREVCLTESDECFYFELLFNQPVATSQIGDYRVCAEEGALVTDPRDIVYNSSYHIQEHTCEGILCMCLFDDGVPEEDKYFYIATVPPDITATPSQLIKLRVEDNEASNNEGEMIQSIMFSPLEGEEGIPGVITITASTALTGYVDIAIIYGTSILNEDISFGGFGMPGRVPFFDDVTQSVNVNRLVDDDYESMESATIWIVRSPVALAPSVVPIHFDTTDLDFALGVYPDTMVVGYEGCVVQFLVFTKDNHANSATVNLVYAVISGNDADLTIAIAPSSLSSSNLFATVDVVPTSTLAVEGDQFYQIEITATDTSNQVSKQIIELQIKHFDSTTPTYHAAQDKVACITSQSPCQIPVCVVGDKSGTSQSYVITDVTAAEGADYTEPSLSFTLDEPVSSDPEVQYKIDITTMVVSAPQLPKDFVVTLTDVSEDVTVQLIHSIDDVLLWDDDVNSQLGFKYFAIEGQNYFIPGLEVLQDWLMQNGIPPEGVINARGETADLDIDFTVEVQSQSGYVFFSIVQDDEVEGTEEFVVYVECNPAVPAAARYSATICIIDDDKEEEKDVLSTTEVASTTEQQSTTDLGSTTAEVSTTVVPSTTREVSTTAEVSTTIVPSTTREESTTADISTTAAPSTTAAVSTTESLSTTEKASTTFPVSTTESISSTMNPSTTVPISTTAAESTTDAHSTTEPQSTTDAVSTTMRVSTTEPQTTTDVQSTTFESTSEGQSTTFESTTFISTTFFSSTVRVTTTLPVTTAGIVTTQDAPTTRDDVATTREDAATTGDGLVTTPVTEGMTTMSLNPSTNLNTETTPLPTTSSGNCLENEDICHSDATCVSLGDGFGECQCNEGFQGNGFSCVETAIPRCCPIISDMFKLVNGRTQCAFFDPTEHGSFASYQSTKCEVPGVTGGRLLDLSTKPPTAAVDRILENLVRINLPSGLFPPAVYVNFERNDNGQFIWNNENNDQLSNTDSGWTPSSPQSGESLDCGALITEGDNFGYSNVGCEGPAVAFCEVDLVPCAPGCPGQFQCADDLCINNQFMCDDIDDCESGNDEDNCENACEAVAPPDNGFQLNVGTTARQLYQEGSTIMFGCIQTVDMSFTLVGNANVTCTAGSFGTLPECLEDCTLPTGAPSNVVPEVMQNFYSHGSSLTYMCDADSAGVATQLTCDNGNFQGNFPSCSLCTSLGCHVNAHCRLDDNNDPVCICDDGFVGTGVTCNPATRKKRSVYEPFVSSAILLPDSFHISVLNRKYLYYTENGVIRFTDAEVSATAIHNHPEKLGDSKLPLIAMMWGEGISGNVEHRIYDNPEDPAESMVMWRIGSNVRDWDDTQFASSIAFEPTWAIVITWKNVKHIDYPSLTNTLECILATDGFHTFSLLNYQSANWPVQEKVLLGINTGSMVTEINDKVLTEAVKTTDDDVSVYQIHEAVGNSGLPGRWLFRMDSYDNSNSDSKEKCANYIAEEHSPLPLEHVKRCPDQLTSILSFQFRSCSFEVSQDEDLSNFGYPNADRCLTQKVLSTYPENSPGSYCTYDQDGLLLPFVSHENVWDATVVQKFVPSRFNEDQGSLWLSQDIDFRYQCCILSGSDDFCDLYQSVRPSPSKGMGNVNYASAGVYGGGHYSTFDGLQYSFNAIGEFTLLRMEDVGMEIQVRSASQNHGSGATLEQSPVINAMSVEMDTTRVEVYLEEGRLLLKADGNELLLDELRDGRYLSSQVLISWGPDVWNHSQNALDIVLLPTFLTNVTSEMYLHVTSVSRSLSVIMSVDDGIISRGSTEGLAGVANGNSWDDLRFPDGRKLDFTEAAELTDAFVFEFGGSWRTTPSTSLFRFNDDYDWSDHNNVDFTPIFFEHLDERNLTQASEFCESITECMYDFEMIDPEVAASSLNIRQIFEREKLVKVNHPPTYVGIEPLAGESSGLKSEDGVILLEVGQSSTYQILAADLDGDEVKVTLIGTLLEATISAGGILNWTPTSTAPRDVRLRLSDGLTSITIQLKVRICNCDGDCFYRRVWEEDFGRQDSVARTYCLCSDGLISKSCSADVDRCDQNPCYPGVTCIDPGRPQLLQCGNCPPPLIGDGMKCNDVDECLESDTCGHICINEFGGFSCQCYPGYELLPDGRGCQDINECERQESPCGGNSDCANTEGSFTCVCRPGYQHLKSSLLACADINECRNENPCGEYELCVNDAGTYHCSCARGFIRHEGICQDLDECLSPLLSNCHPNAECINEVGSHRCQCKEGFEGNGKICRDRNECAISPFFCHPRFECINTGGSYSCSCPDGFAGNGDDCYDINECETGAFNCADHMICINRVGSYECQCENGYSKDDQGVCQNVNECQRPYALCPANSNCVDTEGSFDCVCDPRYFKHVTACLDAETQCSSSPYCEEQLCDGDGCSCPDGFYIDEDSQRCFDENECLRDGDLCNPNSECINIPGGYTCRCRTGFVRVGESCEDIVNCGQDDTCSDSATCIDTDGTYTCECKDGFQGNGRNCVDSKDCQEENACLVNFVCKEEDPGKSCRCPDGFQVIDDACTDINECSSSPCLEEATCHNTAGSFYCQCPRGYFGDGQKTAAGCIEINECQTGAAKCPLHSYCENQNGSYVCMCEEGYELQGELCVDVNECSRSLSVCMSNSSCVNLPGTSTCRCNPGFFNYVLGQQRHFGICQDIDECEMGLHDCSPNANCQNAAGSYECKCKDGYEGDGITCQDINECYTSRPCSQQAFRSCLNRDGSYRCICQIGYYQNSQGTCSESNSIELRVEFSDVKGLQTRHFYDLITESMLDQLSEDMTALFKEYELPEYILQVLVMKMTKLEAGTALVVIRVDFDLRANMTSQRATTIFGELLKGRHNNVVPPDSIVLNYEAFYAEENPCLLGNHECFELGYSHCVPTRDGGYECSDCATGFRDESGNCVPDPCQNGGSDCAERFFTTCVNTGGGEFTCQGCQPGFIQQDTNCVADPCQAGQRKCERLNFVECVPDGNNQYHCQTCQTGFRLENGVCISLIRNNPCVSGEDTCEQRKFQTCVFDAEGVYHCENCLPGYRHEGDQCLPDPCQVNQNDCQERNFDRCIYTSGGGFSCSVCKAGYVLEGAECIKDDTSNLKRYRGQFKILSINSSQALAVFQQGLSEVNSDLFRVYEESVCSVLTDIIPRHSSLLRGLQTDCFVFSFRNGSIITHLALDFMQAGRIDLSHEINRALTVGGSQVPEGLSLTRSDGNANILIDPSFTDFIDTSTYGCNRNAICANGGTCLEDPVVYGYECRCPTDYQGRFCQLTSQRPIEPSVPPTDETLSNPNSFPSWTIALLAVAVLLSVGLCACCCCLFTLSYQKKHPPGVYTYPSSGKSASRSIPVRNPLVSHLGRGSPHVPYYNPAWEADEEPEDDGTKQEKNDERRLKAFSHILNNADYFNERMTAHAEGRTLNVVRNPHAESQRQEFARPYLADGTEVSSNSDKAPPPYKREYLELSGSSSEEKSISSISGSDESYI